MTVASHELEVTPLRPKVTVELAVPDEPHGLVVIAHHDAPALHARNVGLAWCLQHGHFATALVSRGLGDWLDTPATHGRLLTAVARWALNEPACAGLRAAVLGLGTGATGALAAAALAPALVKTVVVFDAQPALTRLSLRHVASPALLIASRSDPESMSASVNAFERLPNGSGLSFVDDQAPLEVLVEVALQTRRWLSRALWPAGGGAASRASATA